MDFYADPEYILSPCLSQPSFIDIPYTSLKTTSDSDYPPHHSQKLFVLGTSDTHLTPTSLHTGSTAASVTSSAKATIWSAANSYGGGCCICSSPYTEVARMIGESISPNLYDIRFHGLFPIRALGYPQNGILLCPDCHYVLSRNSRPDIAILPNDLQWFMEFEERDFAYRKQVWMAKEKAVVELCQGQAISRQVESGDSCDYGGLYEYFCIRNYHGTVPHLRPPGEWVSKQWHGAPALCIWELLRRPYQQCGQRHINLAQIVRQRIKSGG
ncbi:hypothetical protein BGX38DRAFT_1223927 [Terfezia claveryi]|nr:hypothetical protein BGX38DRAFT_1223927 [Terfezia claveryi]